MDRRFSNPYGSDYRQPYPQHSPRTPRPMQYFTSGNSPRPGGFGSPRDQFNRQNYRSPVPRAGSPHGQWRGAPDFRHNTPRGYTPSPVMHSSPGYRDNQSWGGPSFTPRGRGRGRGRVGGERAPIDKYFSEQMMRDPWEGLAPHPIDKLT